MNNEKLQKIDADIVKAKAKITEYTAKLRELERLKTETENAGIVSLVRDMDILPDELMEFIRTYKEQQSGGTTTIPTPASAPLPDDIPPDDEKEEDLGELWEQLKKSYQSSPPQL